MLRQPNPATMIRINPQNLHRIDVCHARKMPTLGQATTGLLALTAILVLTRSLSTMAGYNTRGLWLDSALTSAPKSSQAEVLARTRRVAAAVRYATSSPPPPPPPTDACLDMRQLHGVVPHVTWGSLPEAEQARHSPTPHAWHPPTTTYHLHLPPATYRALVVSPPVPGPRCQATWTALDCDRQQQPRPKTQTGAVPLVRTRVRVRVRVRARVGS